MDINESLRAAFGIMEYGRAHGGAVLATAEEIQTLRAALGLSQGQLGTQLCVPQNLIWRWEHGHQRPRGDRAYSARLIEMLAKARELGVLPARNGEGSS